MDSKLNLVLKGALYLGVVLLSTVSLVEQKRQKRACGDWVRYWSWPRHWQPDASGRKNHKNHNTAFCGRGCYFNLKIKELWLDCSGPLMEHAILIFDVWGIVDHVKKCVVIKWLFQEDEVSIANAFQPETTRNTPMGNPVRFVGSSRDNERDTTLWRTMGWASQGEDFRMSLY